MLEENLPARFQIPDVLPLAGLLLDEFVGHEKADRIVRHAHPQAIARRKIPFIGTRESRGISPIRIICQHRRIEIALGVKSLSTRRKPVRPLRVGNSRRAVRRGKTSATGVEPSVPSCRDIFLRRDLDDAAEFPSVFGGKTCGHHTQ